MLRWARHFGARSLFIACMVFSATAASAACVDLSKGSSFTLTRNEPFFQVTNRLAQDGTVREDRTLERDGTTERVSTEYWNGVIAVDRKTAKSRIEMQVPTTAKSLDLSVKGKKYTLPMTVHINGKEYGRGTFIVRPIKKTKVQIGKCRYPAMIVRTTLRMENRADINEEALLSLEAGMLLGNTAMTATWQPKHGVFFDRIEGH